MTLAQIKALFKTGAIPTQADFANLIDKIPNNEGGGEILLLMQKLLTNLLFMNESSGAGIDFFDETDEECIAILESISYYKFAKEGSSN